MSPFEWCPLRRRKVFFSESRILCCEISIPTVRRYRIRAAHRSAPWFITDLSWIRNGAWHRVEGARAGRAKEK
jgi:hypothetical protein